ncbi:MAG: hypothetical protein GXY62_10130, partial [Thermotogaceae bacterium]|nr:hypothetical protein [Thermotogaceae bacterium]
MTGLERNVASLFSNGGHLFVVALDHPQFFGPVEGIDKPAELIERLSMSRADGFIVNPGITRLLNARTVSGKKLIVRSSIGGSKFSDYKTFHPAVVS